MAKWKRRKKYRIEQPVEETATNTRVNGYRVTKLLKRELILTALTVLLATSVTLGGSYAIFSNIQKAEQYNVIKTGTLQIAYDDTSTGLGNIISLNGAYPESDTTGQQREPYRFKITNTGSLNTEYKVKVLDDSDMIAEDGCGEKLLDKTKIKYSINGGEAVILDTIKEEYVVVTGSLNVGESVTYEIRMWIDEAAGNEVLGTHYHGKIVVEGAQAEPPAVETLLMKTNAKTLSYDDATEEQKQEMFTFTHEAGEQQVGWSEEELTDYRYVGTTPNNYVTFNDELWRMIGIFTVEGEDGSKEQRVKIIRDESIGNYSWDNKTAETGSSASASGSSDWSDSTLQQVLNSGPYYNRTSGICPFGENNATTACEFSSIGLTSTAKSMIGITKWYIGGVPNANVTQSTFYVLERGMTAPEGRPTNWIGEIGLIYPSDYGYATGSNSCLSTNLVSYDDNCINSNWIYNSVGQWTITPRSSYSYSAYNMRENGVIGSNSVYYTTFAIRPSVYLKSNVIITEGDGSKESPYQLSN